MFLEDAGDTFRNALYVRDDNHAFSIVLSVVRFFAGCRVRFWSLLGFLNFVDRPFWIAASGQCFVYDLFLLLFVIVICNDRVFPIVKGSYDSEFLM